MEERFERISVSVQPEILAKLKMQADRENLPLSRFLVNAALNEVEKSNNSKQISKAGYEEIKKSILNSPELWEIKKQLLENALQENANSKTFCDPKASAEWGKMFKELKKMQAETEEDRLADALGWNEPQEPIDPLDIAKGKRSIQEYRQQKEIEEYQAAKKFFKK